MANHNDYYYAVAYNDEYYYNRGYANSQKARLNMLTEANYIVERGSYNSYLFERLQDAFYSLLTLKSLCPYQRMSHMISEQCMHHSSMQTIRSLEALMTQTMNCLL